MTGARRARFYDSARSAHLERFRTMTPAVTYFRTRRYDFDVAAMPADGSVVQRGRWASVLTLLRRHYDAVEVNEPLMTGRWWDLVLQLAAIRLRSALTRRPTIVGAYCIGLTDPQQKLMGTRRLPAPLAAWWARVVVRNLVRRIDRLAFGTDATRDLLSTWAGASLVASRARMFPAVPAACDCPAEDRDPHAVLFVGAFSERKGIRPLMAAWDALPAGHPLSLTMIGTGPLQGEVEAWAAGHAEVTVIIDPPRVIIHRALRRAHVVTLLSQRAGYWREQVGLPIVEGLAHGCEIVASDETGLASWLREHGHRVVTADATPQVIAAALLDAAADPRDAEKITTVLPHSDPRADADRWLLAAELAPTRHDRRRISTVPALRTVRLYADSTRRSLRRYGLHPQRVFARSDDRPVFVVGSPRSGTSFVAAMIGTVEGFSDLGEWRPWKVVIPRLAGQAPDEAAPRIRAIIRRALRATMRSGTRAVEQTPESTFLIPAIAAAFPDARFVHMIRDGRDVASSLISLGWVSPTPNESSDEVGQSFGAQARFWVEAERRAEFAAASEATRAGWVWRRYETTARAALASLAERTVTVRYEDMVTAPEDTARRLAAALGTAGRAEEFVAALGHVRASSVQRWRHDLDAAQLADITAEAGALLAELDYPG